MADIRQLLLEAAARYGVPAPLALGLAKQESGFRPGAISPAGAIGVMQLMPGTARELGVDPYNVNQNIDGGMRYLKAQIDKFGIPMGLAAYNAGPGRVQRHLQTGSPLPAETQKYIPAVLANAQGASGMPMQNVPQIPGSAPTLPPTFTPPTPPAPTGPTMTAGAPLSLAPPTSTASASPLGGLGSLGGMMQLAQLFGLGGGGAASSGSAPAPAPMPPIPPPQPPPMNIQALAHMLQNPSYKQAAPGRRFYS